LEVLLWDINVDVSLDAGVDVKLYLDRGVEMDLDLEIPGGLCYYSLGLAEEVAEGGSKSPYYLDIYSCSQQL
jgi:hypothetical protein